IVKEDHRSPVVVSQIWYKVGSSYEVDGNTGLAHVLEHMMFKGTKNLGPNEFSRIIAENGGRENAFTSRDYTAYFQRLESSRLEVSFKHEADRMSNLVLSEEEFQKEVKVVMEERRLRTDDKPKSLTYEQFQATAFTNSPYRNPVIGWMVDLEQMKLEDLEQWYRSWYRPNNATIVVVGDVEPEAVLALAKRYFGPLKPGTIPLLKTRTEVKQLGERRITMKVPAQLPYVMMGYKVPVVAHAEVDWEPYALDVLSAILGGANSARLTRDLVRSSSLAVSAGSDYSAFSRLNGLFLLDATPTPEHSTAEVESALRAQVETMSKELVTGDELDRVKAQVVAAKVFEQDSGFYQAMQIGRLETVGLSWKLLDEYPHRIRAVTAEQVRAVAKKYLLEDQLTVATLQPLSMKKADAMGTEN
ncbi:MAG TPA: insulinase family protein, partial [Chromatiales bacterium]|nr:insulinase family protein [Chromatiales bacterium]